MTLSEASKLDEDGARNYLEGIRWADGRVCPHCASKRSFAMNGKTTRAGLYKCSECRKPFTVMVGTIFQGSHIKLREWVIAFHMMCASKKGVSAMQLQRMLGLKQYKSAWHLAHRIRYAMAEGAFAPMLRGTIEVDETYVGGKPRKYDGKERKRGRGTSKTPVVVLVERNGKARSTPMKRLTGKNLKKEIIENVHASSTIMTDEFKSYNGIGKHFEGGHKTVNHGSGEYARGDINSNTAESYFALLKRGIVGAFHHVSDRHLHRYCAEFDFRWNHRDVTDGERTVSAIGGATGKRLSYV